MKGKARAVGISRQADERAFRQSPRSSPALEAEHGVQPVGEATQDSGLDFICSELRRGAHALFTPLQPRQGVAHALMRHVDALRLKGRRDLPQGEPLRVQSKDLSVGCVDGRYLSEAHSGEAAIVGESGAAAKERPLDRIDRSHLSCKRTALRLKPLDGREGNAEAPARSRCSHRRSARAARTCSLVINLVSPNDAGRLVYDLSGIVFLTSSIAQSDE